MIYRDRSGRDNKRSERGAAERILPTLHLKLQHLLGGNALFSELQIEEISQAIDLYLNEQPTDEASLYDEPYLAMLASRALSSLGAGKSAMRLLVYGTGLMAPALWEISRGTTMWILDMRRLTINADASLELTLFRCLEAVISATAELWDEAQGEGTLGLRHVCRAAAQLLRQRVQSDAARALAEEIRQIASEQFKTLASLRGWQTIPEVINLDF